jgi:hypothetical protein
MQKSTSCVHNQNKSENSGCIQELFAAITETKPKNCFPGEILNLDTVSIIKVAGVYVYM